MSPFVLSELAWQSVNPSHHRRQLAHPEYVCLKFNRCAAATGPAMIDFDLIAWED
jgi:hypothetical protein